MSIFLCRWPNGDVSIVSARNKDDAIEALDEFDNADHAEISQLKAQFLVDFRLDADGHLELNQFGESTQGEIMETAFPELEKTQSEDPAVIRQAVELERTRLWETQKETKEAKTEIGQRLQEQLGAAAVVADRAVEREAKEVLKNFKSKNPKH
jgi:hypothetical protein